MAYSVSDIKCIHEQNGGYFFSRDTMRFFGDTMKSFGVRNRDDGIYLYRKHSRHGGVWVFNPETGDLRPRSDLSPKDIGA